MTSHSSRGEWGFTLIELLVVMVIIAILAAIAIPLFFEQREKAFESQMQSALKHAATAAETFVMDQPDGYSRLDDFATAEEALAGYGFKQPTWAQPPPVSTLGYLRFRDATATSYCIEARHEQLSSSSAWRRSTYWSSNPAPAPTPDNC